MTSVAKKIDKDFDCGRLKFYISNAIEAAEHGAEDYVRSVITSMTHSDFEKMLIVFDLQGNYYGPMVKEMVEKIIRESTSKDFQDRVSFVE